MHSHNSYLTSGDSEASNQLYCLLSGPFHLQESAFMEKHPRLWKTLSVFCCRSPHEAHEIRVQSHINVPTVVPTPTLDLKFQGQIINSRTCNFIGTSGHQWRLPVPNIKLLPHLLPVLGL